MSAPAAARMLRSPAGVRRAPTPLHPAELEGRRKAGAVAVAAGVLVVAVFVWVMLAGSYDQFAALLIAAVLVALTVPIARHAARIEHWPAMVWIVMAAMVLRLGGAIVRYAVAYGAYSGVADASTYTTVAQTHYHAFRSFHFFAPTTGVFKGLVPWIDTLIYAIAGPTEVGAFFVFSWISFVGAYLFYRAFRIAFPEGDRRRYGLLVFFVPSMVYWPSSLGKEGWMVFAIGLATYGLARALAGKPGGYLGLMAGIGAMLLVRPHLALIFLPAAVIAFLLRRTTPGKRRPVGRLIGIVVLIVSSLVVVAKAQSYFGITNLDVQTVTKQLNTTRQQTDLGNSAFNPPNAESPLGFPEAVVTVLYRPFPFEAHSITVLVASFEGLIMLGLTAASWRRLKRLPRMLWRNPFVVFAVVYTALFVLAFSNFANFGILARERVQMFPLFLVLLAVPVVDAAARGEGGSAGSVGSGVLVTADAPAARALVPVGARRELSPVGARRELSPAPRPAPLRRLRAYGEPAGAARRVGRRDAVGVARSAPLTLVGSYRALGHSFDVECSSGLADHLRWMLEGLASPATGEHRYRLASPAAGAGPDLVAMDHDGEPLGTPAALPDTLMRMMTDLNMRAVTSRPDDLVLHASALALDGQGLLLPGPSGAGKSTLAAALVSAGLEYLTDEAAAIDPENLDIHAYRKPLSLRPGSLALLGQSVTEAGPAGSHDLIPASALRAGSMGRAGPVAARLLVFPSYQASAPTRLTPMSRAEALVEVANNSFNFVDHGGEWMDLLRRLVMRCWCGRLSVGDLDRASAMVIDLARAARTGTPGGNRVSD
ncbi:MAG: glycosyltransferase family 39 protein [Acidimicrobiales bacterium]